MGETAPRQGKHGIAFGKNQRVPRVYRGGAGMQVYAWERFELMMHRFELMTRA